MTDPFETMYSAHKPEELEIWQNSTVGIAGAGGLGSNIAIALTRAGIGKIIVADFDVVNPSNLNRQQYYSDQIGMLKVLALQINIARIGANTELVIHPIRIVPENVSVVFREAQVMIEAFDSAEQKQMLLETWINANPDKPYIGASGLAGVGGNELITTESFGNVHIIGDGSSELCPPFSPLAPRVAVVANMQANLCLELLLKRNL